MIDDVSVMCVCCMLVLVVFFCDMVVCRCLWFLFYRLSFYDVFVSVLFLLYYWLLYGGGNSLFVEYSLCVYE